MKSIRTKLTVTYLFLILVIVAMTAGLLEYSLRDYSREKLKQEMITEAEVTSTLVGKIENTPQELNKLVLELGQKTGARVTIISPQGRVLADSAADYRKMENHLHRPEVQTALQKGLGVETRYSFTQKENLLYIAKTFQGHNQLKGIIRLAIPLSKAYRVPAAMNRILSFSIFFATLTALVLSFIFARWLSIPLKEITLAAKRMATGDFNFKINYRSDDEIGQLALNINDMAASLQEKVAELSFEKNRMETVVNYIVSGVILLNREGEILLINPKAAEIFGVEARKVLGRHNLSATHHYHLDEKAREALAAGEVLTTDLQTILPEEKSFLAYFVPLPRERNKQEVLIVLHDITSLRQLEQMRVEFVANASHELRSPLTAIKGFAETLLDGALEDADLRQRFVQIINREAERLDRLVKDLLDLARIESKKIKMDIHPFELKSLVDQVQTEFSKQLREKGIFFKENLPADLPKVYGDRDWLHQVLINLIDNSIKYTSKDGVIEVKAMLKDNELMIEVKDSGQGIPKKDLPRIFERFYRVDKARSRELGGTGLGLSIVKHIIESHGGKIGVSSELGRGTTIHFTLPID
ncbi:ATP-binding protein [Bacillota bacterium LX-D]|nr:ATP-binding protein [Bacillota bacterium LX-D]